MQSKMNDSLRLGELLVEEGVEDVDVLGKLGMALFRVVEDEPIPQSVKPSDLKIKPKRTV